MTPNVIEAKIKRLEARKPNMTFWLNHRNDKFKKLAQENLQYLEDEIKELQEKLNEARSNKTPEVRSED